MLMYIAATIWMLFTKIPNKMNRHHAEESITSHLSNSISLFAVRIASLQRSILKRITLFICLSEIGEFFDECVVH